MAHLRWTFLIALVAMTVACTSVTTVTELGQDGPPAGSVAAEPGAGAGAAAQPVEPELDPESEADEATATASASLAASSEPWDAEIKRERRERYDQVRRDIDEVFNGPLSESALPAPDLASVATGEFATMTLTIEHVFAPDDPLVVHGVANASGSYEHTWAERSELAMFLTQKLARFGSDEDLRPGGIETIQALSNGSLDLWSRGITPGMVRRDAVGELDQTRWYSSESLVQGTLRLDIGFSTPETLWGLLKTEPTAAVTGGGTTYQATLEDPRRTAYVFGGRVGAVIEDATVTVTATYDSDGQLERVEAAVEGDPHLSAMSIVVESRGVTPDIPQIAEGWALPTFAAPVISSDTYSWTATGSSVGSAETWSATGRVQKGFYGDDYLAMTARDIQILADLPTISVPADHLVRRWGFDWVTTMGLFAELAPEGVDGSLLESDVRYGYDPFKVAANLFPHGLGDQQQWVELRTVPDIVELDGWEHHRVSTGVVNPEYWNVRQSENHGFFTWLRSEDPSEIFEVTIGADSDGKVERFALQTTDPDGGGLLFDVRIDEVTTDGIKWSDARPGGGFHADPDYVPPTAEEGAASFDEFAAASRSLYPLFDRSRTPEFLTVLTRRVRDEPSGAYTPAGDYHQWPSVYFENLIVGYLPTEDGERIGVVCLELNDNEWHFTTNNFERLWRGYEDGASLDDQILRYNQNAWVSIDLYAADGERLAGDPCAA